MGKYILEEGDTVISRKRFLAMFGMIAISSLLLSCSVEEIKPDKPVNPQNDNKIEDDDKESIEMPKEDILHFIGRASVRIEYADGTVVYIDPAEGDRSEYEKSADLVLVTHQHSDHNQVDLVKLNEGAVIIQCPNDITAGNKATFKDITINAVSAYNTNHRKEVSCGFVLAKGDLVIYHSGDTSITSDMDSLSSFNIDYAMLCMDGYYNMGPDDALKAAQMIKARYIIPIHTSKSGLFDQQNAERFAYENKIILEPGMETAMKGISNNE